MAPIVFYLYFESKGYISSKFTTQCIQSIYSSFEGCTVVGYSIEKLLRRYSGTEYERLVYANNVEYYISDYLRYKVASILVKRRPCIYTDIDVLHTKETAAILTKSIGSADTPLYGYPALFVATKPNEGLDRLVAFYESYQNANAKYTSLVDRSMLRQCFGTDQHKFFPKLGSVCSFDDEVKVLNRHIVSLQTAFNLYCFTRARGKELKEAAKKVKKLWNIKDCNAHKFSIVVVQDFSLSRDEVEVLNHWWCGSVLLVGSQQYFYITLLDYHDKQKSLYNYNVDTNLLPIQSSLKLSDLPYSLLHGIVDKKELKGFNKFRFHYECLFSRTAANFFKWQKPCS